MLDNNDESLKKMIKLIPLDGDPTIEKQWCIEHNTVNYIIKPVNVIKYYQYHELGANETMNGTYQFNNFKEDIDITDVSNQIYVDESIVTFNSPDLEDNQNLIDNNNLEFRIVGIAEITGNKADTEIDFTSDSIFSTVATTTGSSVSGET